LKSSLELEKVSAEKMHRLGIFNGLDLKGFSEYDLIRHFGKQGSYYYHIARAIDNREVQPNRERKSVGAENTFEYDIDDPDEMLDELEKIGQTLYRRIEKSKAYGRTLTIKIKFSDFKQITRSKTYPIEIDTYEVLWYSAKGNI
jgi:DNA polymerase-4